MVFPEPQLYIAFAVFVAIAAMIAADVRDKERQLIVKRDMNLLGLTLLAGSWIAMLHILVAMFVKNKFPLVEVSTAVPLFAHAVVLFFALIGVTAFYSEIAKHREPPAVAPLNPPTIHD